MSEWKQRVSNKQDVRQRRVNLRKLLIALGCIVLFAAMYIEILPAVSISQDKATQQAGFYGIEGTQTAEAAQDPQAATGAEGSAPAADGAEGSAPAPAAEGSAPAPAPAAETDAALDGASNLADGSPSDPVAAPMPAARYDCEVQAAGGKPLSVRVEADEGALPEGTQMRVRHVDDERVLGAAKAAATDVGLTPDVAQAVAVDIAFVDTAGYEIQPLKNVRAQIASSTLAQANDLTVVHLDDEQQTSVLSNDATVTADRGEASFEASPLCVCALVYTPVGSSSL